MKKVNEMKILFIGDIVGAPGRQALSDYLPRLKQQYKPQVTIANGENASGGRGLSEKNYKELKTCGVDIVTMGNHTWDHSEIYDYIDRTPSLIRPANYPDSEATPGRGMTFIRVNDQELAVINLHGRSFMGDFDSPFKVGQQLVAEAKKRTDYIFVDFHAETTSEKEAMGWFLDGTASAVVGTHTHVQTGDERILPQGTAYVTDVGMTGFYDGILGMEKEPILEKFLTQMPTRFSVPKGGRKRLNACLIDLKTDGRARSIKMIRIDDDNPMLR